MKKMTVLKNKVIVYSCTKWAWYKISYKDLHGKLRCRCNEISI